MPNDTDSPYVTHVFLDSKMQVLSADIKALGDELRKPPNWLAIIGTCISLLGLSITATGLIAGLLWFVFSQEIKPIREDVQRTSDVIAGWSNNRYTNDDGMRDREASKERDAEIMRLLERDMDATDARLSRIEAKIAGWEGSP